MKEYTDKQLILLTGSCGFTSAPSIVIDVHSLSFLKDYFENNNELIKAYLLTPDENGITPNSLDISVSPHVPDEVKDMLDALNHEHPLIHGAATSREAMELIKPRFAQYGSEVYPYIERMVDILREREEQTEQSEQSEQSEQAEQAET